MFIFIGGNIKQAAIRPQKFFIHNIVLKGKAVLFQIFGKLYLKQNHLILSDRSRIIIQLGPQLLVKEARVTFP